MPTTIVKTIGASGSDYTTIASWEAACPANLTSSDEIWQGQGRDEEFNVTATTVIGGGVTSDATRYMDLTCIAGAEHHGRIGVGPRINFTATPGAGTYFLEVASSAHHRVRWWQSRYTGGAIGAGVQIRGFRITSTAYPSYFDRIIARDIDQGSTSTDRTAVGISCQGGSCYNSIAHNIGRSDGSDTDVTRGFSCSCTAGQTIEQYNNLSHTTHHGNGYSLTAVDTGIIRFKNSISVLADADAQGSIQASNIGGGGGLLDFSNLATDDLDADDFGGSGHITSLNTATQWVAPNSDDFRLLPGSDLKGAGTDLGAITFAEDMHEINRDTTGAVWDIGPMQFVPGMLFGPGGAVGPTSVLNSSLLVR